MKNKLVLIFFGFFLISNINLLAKKSNPAQIQFGFFRLKRTQINGNANMVLKTSFTYLQPWTGERFAPDEPSSLMYANYVFADNRPNIDFCVGLFRNHSKGDMIIDNYSLHFDKGNSQVGILGGITIKTKSYKKCKAMATMLLGFGPQFSKLEGSNLAILPDNWGIRGFGEFANLAFSIQAPIIKKRWQLSASINTLMHQVKFNSFSISENNIQKQFKNIHYSSYGISPNLQIGYLLK
jgi:hypothetical protein